jgi:hypothetical protein
MCAIPLAQVPQVREYVEPAVRLGGLINTRVYLLAGLLASRQGAAGRVRDVAISISNRRARGGAAPFFVEELRRRKVNPLSVGRSIVATWEPNKQIVLDAIRDLGSGSRPGARQHLPGAACGRASGDGAVSGVFRCRGCAAAPFCRNISSASIGSSGSSEPGVWNDKFESIPLQQ